MSIAEIILEQIKSLQERYNKTADRNIFYELKSIASLSLHLEIEKQIPLLASINIKREITSLQNLIIGYEQEHV